MTEGLSLEARGDDVTTVELIQDGLSRTEDWVGNNLALACRHCGRVFIVSGVIHKNGRKCPECGKCKVFINMDGKQAWIES